MGEAAAAQERPRKSAKMPGQFINVNGTLINPEYIVTAHVEHAKPDPQTPHIQPPSTLVLKLLEAGEIRFIGKDAELLWGDLTKASE